LLLGIACLTGLSLPGCGPSLSPVKGKVTYQGQPVAGATVNFVSPQGRIATGVTDAGGQFALSTRGRPGAEVGSYAVSVTKYSPPSPARPSRAEEAKMKRYQGGKIPALPKSELPEKFGNPKLSGLAADVTGDSSKNDFEFRLSE
jgi:hypothetical protein